MLLLFHPGLTLFTCDDCQKYVYNLETGERETFKAGPQRVEMPKIRPPGVDTPCLKCPRESPEKAGQYELTDANWRTYTLYRRAKATSFHYLTEAEQKDPIVAIAFVILDTLCREHERQQTTRTLVCELAPFLVPRHG